MFDRYARRLRPPPTLTEIPDGTGSSAEIRRREARALLAHVPGDRFLVALDQAGRALASDRLAIALGEWTAAGRSLVFALGGAEGLDRSVLDRADLILSLGPQTWPHLLARAMLAEQLYRARTILDGHPYHRAKRP